MHGKSFSQHGNSTFYSRMDPDKTFFSYDEYDHILIPSGMGWPLWLDKTDNCAFYGGSHKMMHHNNCPPQTQLFDLLIHYCVHFNPNPHYNRLNNKSMLVCGDSTQLVYQNYWQQHNQFLNVLFHYCGHLHPHPILGCVYFERPGLQFLGWMFLRITLLWGTNPDIQLTQPF